MLSSNQASLEVFHERLVAFLEPFRTLSADDILELARVDALTRGDSAASKVRTELKKSLREETWNVFLSYITPLLVSNEEAKKLDGSYVVNAAAVLVLIAAIGTLPNEFDPILRQEFIDYIRNHALDKRVLSFVLVLLPAREWDERTLRRLEFAKWLVREGKINNE